jgi:hypothetical protein
MHADGVSEPVVDEHGTSSVDVRRRRAARNQSVYREVNERIERIQDIWSAPEKIDFVCECADTACSMPVGLSRAQYEEVRGDPVTFVVLPEHVDPLVEEVVGRYSGHWTVRKIGEGARLARSADPRAREA